MSNINIEKELQAILDYEGDAIHHNTFDNIINFVRIYAESVIGEDEPTFGAQNEAGEVSLEDYISVGRNQLRAEQRARIK